VVHEKQVHHRHASAVFHAMLLSSGMETPKAEATIGGWLLLLCFCLAVGQPLNLAIVAVRALGALPIRGWPLGLVLGARVLATAIGVAAAIAILGRQAGAVRLALVALLLWAAVELFVYGTSYFPNNRMPGDTPLYVVATLTYYGVWTAYLLRSTRVRRTLA
jgi:hypothetical protein